MKFCGPKPEAFEKMAPMLEKLKDHIEQQQFEDADQPQSKYGLNEIAAELDRAKQEDRMNKHMTWLKKVKAIPRPDCPKCGTKDQVVSIFYGLVRNPLPTYGLFVRGGCRVGLDSERWYCQRCQVRLPAGEVGR